MDNNTTHNVGETVKFNNRNFTIAKIIPSGVHLARHQTEKGFAPFSYILTTKTGTMTLVQYSNTTKRFR